MKRVNTLKYFVITLIILMLVNTLSITTSAIKTGTTSDGIIYEVYNDSVFVIGYSGSETDLIIPDFIRGYPVEYICRNAFSSCTNLESVIIPESVISIGYRAFFGCRSLSSVTLSKGLEEVCEEAFFGTAIYNDSCNWFDNVLYIGDYLIKAKETITECTIKEGTKLIAEYAFAECEALRSVMIPEGVTIIDDYAFAQCSSLESVKIPDSISSIGEYVFDETALYRDEYNWDGGLLYVDSCIVSAKGLLSNYYVNNKTRLIADGVLWGLERVIDVYVCGDEEFWNSITIGRDNTELERANMHYLGSDFIPGLEYSVENEEVTITHYKGMLSEMVIPKVLDGCPVTQIGENAFSGNIKLRNVIVSEGIKTINSNAFSDCISLESVSILGSRTNIGREAFYGCKSLQNIIMPYDVSSIGLRAFYDTAYYNNPENWEDGVLYIGNSLIEVKEGVSVCRIKDGTTYIAQKAFSSIPEYGVFGAGISYMGLKSIRSIYIPESLKKIGGSSFFYCDYLCDVYIESLNAWCDIEFEDAFANPLFFGLGNLYLNGELLTNIEIPQNSDKINPYAFAGAKAIESVTIPDGVTTIGTQAFWRCYSLEELVVPASVQRVEDGVFWDCGSLRNVYISDMVAWNNIVFEDETEGFEFTEKNLYLNGVLIEDSESTVPTEPSVPGDDEPEVPSDPGNTSTTAPIEPSTGGEDKPTDPTEPSTGGQDNPIDSTEPVVTGLLGDANDDGKVNVKDATEIQKAVAGLLTLDEAGESAADADGSGKVNVKDATAIQKWVAGIETGFLIGEPVKKQ